MASDRAARLGGLAVALALGLPAALHALTCGGVAEAQSALNPAERDLRMIEGLARIHAELEKHTAALEKQGAQLEKLVELQAAEAKGIQSSREGSREERGVGR